MMRSIKFLAALAAAAILTACGGGGSDAGTSPFGSGSGNSSLGGGTGTGTGGGTTPTSGLAVALGLSSTTATTAAPVTVTATVSTRSGPVANAVVTFTTTNSVGRFTPSTGTALTDAKGVAVVSMAPAAPDTAGAAELTASVTVNGETVKAVTGFQLTATNVTIASFTNGLGTGSAQLPAYGQAVPTVQIAGAATGVPIKVSVTSTCIALGKARITPAEATTTTGTATFSYVDNGCGAVQASDTLTASISNSTAVATTQLPIAASAASSLAYVSSTPSTIYLKGSSLAEVSSVLFEVRDGAGNPLPGRRVQLDLSTFAGGLTLEDAAVPVIRESDALGRVSVRVRAGTVPTPVRVRASLPDSSPVITTVSNELTVAVGLPSQANFGLAQQTINIEGYNYIDTPNTYTVIASDRSGNPVPAGTAINFTAEGGQIQASRTIQITSAGIARADAAFVSNLPRPLDGRVTILAYALGEESFKDLNGNNVYDLGEPFQDLGDVYRDRLYDGVYDPANDEFVSLQLPNSLPRRICVNSNEPELRLNVTIPSRQTDATNAPTCDGVWGIAYVRRAVETVLSTSSARPVWSPGSAPRNLVPGGTVSLQTGPDAASATSFDLVSGSTVLGAGGAGTLSFLLADANPVRLNPVAAGSTLEVEGTTGLTVKVVGGSPVPSTSEAFGARAGVSYEFDEKTSAGTVTIRVKSPRGLTTALAVNLVRSGGTADGATTAQVTGLTTGTSGTLQPYAQSTVTVTSNAPAGTAATITLTSTCAARGKATISPPSVTTTTGSATFTYTDAGCGAVLDTDTLTASVNGSTATRTAAVSVAAPSVGSLGFVTAAPATIFLKGSGLAEQSTVAFEVRDTAGNPLPNRDVVLSLSASAGDLRIDGGTGPVTKRSDSQGRVSVFLNAGTVPTPVRVRAEVSGLTPVISAVSSELTVAVGLPSQLNFSLAQSTLNIEGFDYDGVSNTYTITAADRSGNPVPVGTAINFTAEGGQIQATRPIQLNTAGLAQAVAQYVSASPKPADGRITVLAYAIGEESFRDLNGNNVWDPGEPFMALGDPFRDRNFDGVYDSTADEFIPLRAVNPPSSPCAVSTLPEFQTGPEIPSRPNSCEGTSMRSGIYVRRAIETVLSSSAGRPVWIGTSRGTVTLAADGSVSLRTSATGAATTFGALHGSTLSAAGTTGQITFAPADANPVRLNPLPFGTTIGVSASTGLTATLVAGDKVANTLDPRGSPVSLRYTFDAATTSGVITVIMTTPRGVVTAATVAIER